MARPEEKIIGRRLKTSYITTVASISLVLFVLGLLGLTILYAQRLSAHVKENIGITVFLKEDAGIEAITSFQRSLDGSPAVKSTAYISKEQAAQDLTEELGEDFVAFLGYNPLPASVIIRLHAGYANPDSLAAFEKMVLEYPLTGEVDYQRDLVHLINENVKKIGAGLLLFSMLLLMIAFALINNTIRLSVFSRRFLIKSMQLVGATQSFIRKPFVLRGVMQGLVSAVLSNILLIITLYTIEQKVPELTLLSDMRLLLMLFGAVMLLGMIISWISTFLAVRKYLKIKTDSLYYY